jgi:hypothetical protein
MRRGASKNVTALNCLLMRLDHFVIAVWRAKEAESGPREVLGNNRP